MFNRSNTVQGGNAIYDTQKTLAEKIAKRRIQQMQTPTAAFDNSMGTPAPAEPVMPVPEAVPPAVQSIPAQAVQPGQTVNTAAVAPAIGMTTQEQLRRIAQSRRSIGI